MEVHHPSNPAAAVGKKNLKEYALEFIMLFLAVTLGFFAENIREHSVENGRIKKYMASLYNDLNYDISKLNFFKQRRIEKNRQCDLLVQQLTASVDTNNQSTYYYARKASRRDHFYPRDEIINQLNTTGSYRLI